MAGEYAKNTTVAVSRSLEEIKTTLIRFGADRSTFTYVEQGNHVGIQFRIRNRVVRMTMLLPEREAFATDRYGRRRPDIAIDKDHDQVCREHWRTLLLGVKAKLAMIEKGLSTVEREFLADILLPSGQTIGEQVIPEIDEAVTGKTIPSLVTGLPSPKVIALGERAG